MKIDKDFVVLELKTIGYSLIIFIAIIVAAKGF